MSDDRDFDPRFDPAFQRGYEGVVDAPAPAARPTTAAPRRAAQPEPVTAQAPAAERTMIELPAPTDDRSPSPAPRAVQPLAADEDAPPRTNPFIIVLIVLSVALVGGGLYLVVKMRDLFADTQSSTDFDFVTLQVLIGVAPIAIGLGIATAIGVLFIYAIRWGRAR